MRSHYRQQLPLLIFLASDQVDAKQASTIVKSLTGIQIKILAEIAHNILKGGVTIPTDLKEALKANAKCVRIIGNARTAIADKRRYIIRSIIKTLINTSKRVLMKKGLEAAKLL